MVNLRPPVMIEYKDKKTSSGKVVDGVIYLSISNRLSQQLKQEHIDKLTEKLLSRINWAQGYKFSAPALSIHDDRSLWNLANTINTNYYKLPLKDASFHSQKSTWGTCSLRTGRIYVSQRLIGAPLELLWYVVAHEICHLAVPGHNHHFWKLVSKSCPDYQESRKGLKAYGLR